MEHSTQIFENLKPVEKLKKIILASIENLQKLYWFSKLGGWGSKIKPATSILHSWKKGHFLKIEFGDMHNWNLSRLSGFRDMNRKSDLSISPAQRPNQDLLLLLQRRVQNLFKIPTHNVIFCWFCKG